MNLAGGHTAGSGNTGGRHKAKWISGGATHDHHQSVQQRTAVLSAQDHDSGKD
jgi:hypothetical protein